MAPNGNGPRWAVPHTGRMQDVSLPKTKTRPKTKAHPALLIAEQGFVSWVLVDNRAVTVHARERSSNKLTGKIVAREGLEFAVGLRDERGTEAQAVAVDVVVDGVVSRADREIFRPDRFTQAQLTYTWRGRKDTSGSIRHFLFQPLSLTDDDTLACEDEQVVRSIGTIQLRICRIEVTGKLDGEPEYGGVGAPPTLHEGSKKARVSHQAGLGPAQPHTPSGRSSFEWIDQPDQPFVVFEFSYLSRTLLELEGVLPPEFAPPPAATPAAGEPKPGSSAAADRKPLQRRRRSSSSSSLSSSSSNAAGTPPPRSSLSTKPRPLAKRRSTSAEAVASRLLPSSPERSHTHSTSAPMPVLYPKLPSPLPAPPASSSTATLSVRGVASERERLERRGKENREMRAELERLRRGRLEEAREMEQAGKERRERERRARSESAKRKKRREEAGGGGSQDKGKGKGKAREEDAEIDVIVLDSDSD